MVFGREAVTACELVVKLRSRQAKLGESRLAVIRIDLGDLRFDWRSLGPRACLLPGLPAGQDDDYRFNTDGEEGLHGQTRRAIGVVDFHLDRPNACVDAPSHVANDTRAMDGAAIVGVLGAIFGAASAKRGRRLEWALKGALVGGGVGAVGGAFIERRKRVVYRFENIFRARLGRPRFRLAA